MATSKIYSEAPLFIRQQTKVTHKELASGSYFRWKRTGFTAGKTFPTYTLSNGDVVNYWPVALTAFATGVTKTSIAYVIPFNLVSDEWYVMSINNNCGSAMNSTTRTASFTCLYVREDQYGEIGSDGSITSRPSGAAWVGEKPLILRKRFSGVYTDLATDKGKGFTPEALGYYVPEGYRLFGISGFTSGTVRVAVAICDPYRAPSSILYVRNSYSSAVSGTASMDVTFIREDYVQKPQRVNLSITKPSDINMDFSSVYPIVGETVEYSVTNPDASYEYCSTIENVKQANLVYGLKADANNIDETQYSTVTQYGYSGSFAASDTEMDVAISKNAYENLDYPGTFYRSWNTVTGGKEILGYALGYGNLNIANPDNTYAVIKSFKLNCETSSEKSNLSLSFIDPNITRTGTLCKVHKYARGSSNYVIAIETNFIPNDFIDDQRT